MCPPQRESQELGTTTRGGATTAVECGCHVSGQIDTPAAIPTRDSSLIPTTNSTLAGKPGGPQHTAWAVLTTPGTEQASPIDSQRLPAERSEVDEQA